MTKIKIFVLFAFLFLFLPHSAKAQVPTFDCSKSIQVYTDVTTGNVYSCKITAGVGTWMLAGGGGGAFGPNFVAGGGTAQAQTVAPTTAVTNATLVNGYQQCWLPIAANTGAAPTLAGSGTSTFSAKPITKYGTTALVANDITTAAIACAIYDGTEFQLQNPQSGPFLATLPTTPNGVSFIDTSTPAGGVGVAPAWSWPGVALNAQTGTSYTIAATDRSGVVTNSNVAATAITLPQAGTTNFANNFNFDLFNINTGLVTITPTTSTINGAATQIVPNKWGSFILSDPSNNYRALTVPDIGAFPSCADSGGNHLNFTTATGALSCGTSGSSAVSSVFSRTGAVVAAANDYTLDQIGNPAADATFQGSVDAAVLIKQFNGTNAKDIFHVQNKGGTEILRIDSGSTLRLQNSLCTLGTTTFVCNEIAVNAGFGFRTLEGAAPSTAAGSDYIYGDSTAHALKAISNNSTGTELVAVIAPTPIHSTGNTAAITTATLCSTSAGNCDQAGNYTVEWAFTQTGTACGTPGTGGVTFLLTWTDSNGTAHSAIGLAMDDSASLVATTGTFHFTTSNATAWASGQFNISSNGSILQYATGYTACSVGTGSYTLDAWVTRKR